MMFDGDAAPSCYSTPVRPRSGVSEKKGSPLRLQELREVRNFVYDIQGQNVKDIKAYLDGKDGRRVEWYNDKLFVKCEGQAKDYAAAWIDKGYSPLEGSGWIFGRTGHVPGPDRAYIPDCNAQFPLLRPVPPPQMFHATMLRPLPHWVMEVDFEDDVDQPDKGFDKVENGYFTLLGPDNSRVEEAWILVLPNEPPVVPEPIVELPLAAQPIVQPQVQRPSIGTCYLVIIQRIDPQTRAYYPMEPNTRFAVPEYSVFSAYGPAGPPGAPPLPVNRMLQTTGLNPVAQQFAPPQAQA